MKRLFFGISLLFSSITIQAFESGIYQCENIIGAGLDTYILKSNKRAKVITMGITERGYWRDEGNEALVIKQEWIIEKRGNKYFIPMNGYMKDIPCRKLKKGEKPKNILPKDTKLGKSLMAR